MTEHSFNGRFRINSVSASDLRPYCNGCTNHIPPESDSPLVLMNSCETSNPRRYSGNSFNETKGVDLNCLSHLNLNKKINCPILDSQLPLDKGFSTTSVGKMVSSDFHSTTNLKLHSPTQTIHKHIDESINSNRKLGKKEEIIVDTGPNGRFLKFSKEIGRGAFKTVYKGIDTETGVAIAWCEINNRRCTRDETVRFKREVEILKKLQHPNILRFYDFFSFTNRRGFVLITELMNAGTLRTYLSRFKSIPLRLIKNWCLQILRGLQFLHSRDPSIIHRDLKCDNIFINGVNGSVKIGDLGLAVLSNTNARTVIGTPEFMAPEMYEEDYDESVDIWAFGLCVLEMYTLEYPYKECRSPAAIFKRVSNGIRPKALNSVEDEDLYNIIKSCTEKEKCQRVTIPMLLNHEFFQEQEIHMEEINPIGSDILDPEIIRLLISRDQKAITLDYNLEMDKTDKVVEELVSVGFAKHDEFQIFVKTLQNRIDRAKRNKHLNGNVVTPNDVEANLAIETNSVINSDKNELLKEFNQNDLFSQPGSLYEKERGCHGRLSSFGDFDADLSVNSRSFPQNYVGEVIPPKQRVKLSLSGLKADKLVCLLISENTNLEFGFSLNEYSSQELVKNMIENDFIHPSEETQFVLQAEVLIDLVQTKKHEKIDDNSIVDYIKSLQITPNNEQQTHYSSKFFPKNIDTLPTTGKDIHSIILENSKTFSKDLPKYTNKHSAYTIVKDCESEPSSENHVDSLKRQKMKLDIRDQSTIDYLTNSQMKDYETNFFLVEDFKMQSITKKGFKSFYFPYCFINDCKERKYKIDNNFKENQAKPINKVSLFNPYDFESTKSNKKNVFNSKVSTPIDDTPSLVSVSDKNSDFNLKKYPKFQKTEISPHSRFLSQYLNNDIFHDSFPVTINITLKSSNPYEFLGRQSTPSLNRFSNLYYQPHNSKFNFFERDKISSKYKFRGDSFENRIQTLKSFDDQQNVKEENIYRQKALYLPAKGFV